MLRKKFQDIDFFFIWKISYFCLNLNSMIKQMALSDSWVLWKKNGLPN